MLAGVDLAKNSTRSQAQGNHHMRTLLALFLFVAVSPALADNFVVKPSKFSVTESLDRLTKALESKGIKVMARVDHAAGAQKAGLKLKPTQLLIFGNPKLGTPTPSPTSSRHATPSKIKTAFSPR
jgi:hypothetical protein